MSTTLNWSGSNAKEVTDTINRLTDRNERLITAISGLTETMKTQGIAQAVSTYNQAYAQPTGGQPKTCSTSQGRRQDITEAITAGTASGAASATVRWTISARM